MKLGMWNRLAVVVTIVFSLGFPVYVINGNETSQNNLRAEVWSACMARHDTTAATAYACTQETTATLGPSRNYWRDLPKGIGFSLLLSGLAYVGIWAITLVVRWILRGRAARA